VERWGAVRMGRYRGRERRGLGTISGGGWRLRRRGAELRVVWGRRGVGRWRGVKRKSGYNCGL